MKDLKPLIEAVVPELVELRQALHRIPELGYEEEETAKRLLTELRTIPGIEIRSGIAGTGIVATLGAEKEGPCVALRSDMDALPIVEEMDIPYASNNPGRMHACGHDGHMACLVGAVKVLSHLQDELTGPVKFIFQPAEETGAGGEKMCQEGALENPKVDAVFGLHGRPTMQLGTAGLRSGALMAGSRNFEIIIRGKGTHAASPHAGVDPVMIVGQLLSAIQTIVSRATDPLEGAVISVTMIEAGNTTNVIPETARMRGTIRGLRNEIIDTTSERLEHLAVNLARSMNGEADVKFEKGYPVTVNDEKATNYFADIGRKVIGETALNSKVTPTMGSEDFAFYAGEVSAAFWFLGICPPDRSTYPGLHNPRFDFVDAAIPLAVELHCETARCFAGKWREYVSET
jgi:amidohydrolase